jgi:hypothetical protein
MEVPEMLEAIDSLMSAAGRLPTYTVETRMPAMSCGFNRPGTDIHNTVRPNHNWQNQAFDCSQISQAN